jgi:hypothetical protein
MGRKTKRQSPQEDRKTGYFLEIIHETPQHEQRRTLCQWQGKPDQHKLSEWACAYRSILLGKCRYVGEYLGYDPLPMRINLRTAGRNRIVTSWGSNRG